MPCSKTLEPGGCFPLRDRRACISLLNFTSAAVSDADAVLLFSSPAVHDYEAAEKLSENDHRIKEGLERAQRLLKQSQKRDYYKILGVKRWALITGVVDVYLLHLWRRITDGECY